jgi:hypothetical protein
MMMKMQRPAQYAGLDLVGARGFEPRTPRIVPKNGTIRIQNAELRTRNSERKKILPLKSNMMMKMQRPAQYAGLDLVGARGFETRTPPFPRESGTGISDSVPQRSESESPIPFRKEANRNLRPEPHSGRSPAGGGTKILVPRSRDGMRSLPRARLRNYRLNILSALVPLHLTFPSHRFSPANKLCGEYQLPRPTMPGCRHVATIVPNNPAQDVFRLADIVGSIHLAAQYVAEVSHEVKRPAQYAGLDLVGARGFEPRTP